MERFRNQRALATLYGVSRDTASKRWRGTGNSPPVLPPDVIVGERFAGWDIDRAHRFGVAAGLIAADGTRLHTYGQPVDLSHMNPADWFVEPRRFLGIKQMAARLNLTDQVLFRLRDSGDLVPDVVVGPDTSTPRSDVYGWDARRFEVWARQTGRLGAQRPYDTSRLQICGRISPTTGKTCEAVRRIYGEHVVNGETLVLTAPACKRHMTDEEKAQIEQTGS